MIEKKDLVEAMTEELQRFYATRPQDAMVNIPVGKLADAVLARIAGADAADVPAVPDYNPEMAEKLRWYDQAGTTFNPEPRSVSVLASDDDTPAVLLVPNIGDEPVVEDVIQLSPVDAQAYGIAVLSAARAQLD